MARIDRLLALVVDQGANELRVGTDREPQMFAYGAKKRLILPPTPDDMLRDLLGELWSEEREREVRAKGHVELDYDAGALGFFHTKLVARNGGVDATFVKTNAPRRTSAAAAAPPPAHSAPAPAHATGPVATAEPAGESPPVEEARQTSTPMLLELVARAAALRASDLHLAEGDTPRVRIDGRLRTLDDAPAPDLASLFALGRSELASIAGGAPLDRGLLDRDGSALRAHVYRTSEGLAAAVRLLPPTAPSLASLRIQPSLLDLVSFPHGLVVMCGATGSGKSTTLAALAQEALHRRSIVLVTLEDPVEYTLATGAHSLVRRRQVGRDVKSFASGLRDALREDLDVLLVGELRDPETIQLALTAAETGHLVLASLHARSAASAIARIVDAYPATQQDQARVQLSDVLRAVVAQRLLPRARGAGRVAAVELLRGTPAVGSIVREGKSNQLATVMQSGKSEGMVTLERSLAALVRSGEVELAEAQAAANDPASLDSALAAR